MGTWSDEALALRCGSKTRIQHCKDDKSMLISHDMKAVSAHCFRCGFHGFVPHGVQRIAELVRRAQEFQEAIAYGRELRLPYDYTLDVPSHAMTWYLQYGISAELAQMYGIGYTPSLDRVVMPVYQDGGLQAVQMRAVQDGVKPKYMNPSLVPLQDVLFESEDGQCSWGVVTEDILSAIKVGQVLSSVSTMGTKMSDRRAFLISEKYKNAIVWYDNDPAGWIGARRAVQQLELLGVNTYRLCTTKDPKAYTKTEIRKLIKSIERR